MNTPRNMNAPRKAGRPRDESIDAAILAAAVDELIDRGFIAASVESIAARAGVAKTTVYRRWPNLTDLAVDATRTFEQQPAEPPQGTVRENLVWLLDGMRRKWGNPRYAALMRRVAADGTVQPEMYKQSRDRLVRPHLLALQGVLRRGVDEGLIDPDADLDWVRQLLTSPIMAAALALRGPVSKAQVAATVDTVLRGVAPLRK